MKKGIKFYVFLLFFILSTFCVSVKTFADTQKQWITLPTSVNQDGTTVNTQIYGYYTNIDNFGQVFVVCDPNTGQETGYAYIPNVKIGDAQTQEIVGYNDSKVLDWDNPKQIYPVSISVIMPNVPASVGWDLDYYNKTGILQRKTASTVTFPGSSSFVYKMPGSDPNYWLIAAQVTNPNPFPITTHVSIELAGMYGENGVSFDGTVSLGSNETKYVLLNNKDIGMLGSIYKGSYYTLLDYNAYISSNNDLEYPGNDPNYSYINYFAPWNLTINGFGNSGNVVPQIPMRPTYYFDLSGIYSIPGFRRLLEPREGYAIYNIETNQWDFFDRSLNPMDSEAFSMLRPFFTQFGFNAPIIKSWRDAKDGIRLSSDNSIEADFDHLYPVPDPFINGTTVKTSMSVFDELAGWLGEKSGSYTHGYELSGPAVVSYTGGECNYTDVHVGKKDVDVPEGTYIAKESTDVNYYDNDWMKNLPVVEAEPIFIDQYKFIPVDGNNIGYLTKTTVPGYRLRVVIEDRPTINITTQPTEIDVTYYDSHGNQAITKWTPSTGWQLIQNNIPSDEDSIQCQISIRYKQVVTGNNPNDFAVKWTNSSNNPPTLHWLSGNDVRNTLCELGMTYYFTRINKYLNPISVAPSMHWASFEDFEEKLIDRWFSDPIEERQSVNYLENNLQNISNQIGNMDLYLSNIITLEANEIKNIASFDKTITLNMPEISLYKVRVEGRYDSYPAHLDDVITLVESTLNNDVIPKLSTTEEAAFVNGGKFYITPTFKAGSGGVISGAEKYFIGQHYQTYEDDGRLEKEFVGIRSTPIGFPDAGVTLCSYITRSTPTNGWIMTPSDEYFSRIMAIQNVIPFYISAPAGQQYWITYNPSTDSISPKPYPVW
ncbi:hypothetical protein [Thermoanaerobacterium thermosaccharolyticum]|uniref:hypothetical protein n=1 Tax=Thermoanaerobacterium thermosaccharolyticum TaxID=1517 RepID=UPI003DA8B66E